MNILKWLFQHSSNDAQVSSAVPVFRRRHDPFYFKATVTIIGLFVFFYSLKLLQGVLVPICFAALIAILLNPLVNRLLKIRVNRVLAIVIALLVAVAVFTGIILFISSQVAHFTEFAPQLKEKSIQIINMVQEWVHQKFNLSVSRQNAMLKDAASSGQSYLGKTLGGLMGILSVVFLLPIYTFLILYYKPLFLNFFYDVFDDRHENKVSDILNETKGAIQSYIVGLLIETAIVSALNAVALLILGVKYAILIGIIGGLLNMIPYIGGLIAIAIPVFLSMLTGDGYTTPLLVIGSYMLIQFLDNNLIQPRIVSSKVNVNAFFTIFSVLLGGALWGVSGMFLSIPFVAICKIIFDRVPELKPWGRILGVKLGPPPPPQDVVSKVDQDSFNESTDTQAAI